MLEGELRIYLDGQGPIPAPAGSTAYIPAGTAHAFEVVSDTARFLNLTTPNHEAFFRAAGQQALERTLPPDMAKVMAATEQFGVEILGPPPGSSTQQDR